MNSTKFKLGNNLTPSTEMGGLRRLHDAKRVTVVLLCAISLQPTTIEYDTSDTYFSDYAPIFSQKLQAILAQVEEFKQLGPDWDGYGAIPVGKDCLDNAFSLLRNLAPSDIANLYDIFPNPHGTISLHWRGAFKQEVFMEIGNKSFSYYLAENDKLIESGQKGVNELLYISTLIAKLDGNNRYKSC
ncbi:MAG: hypothetical protein ACKVTZ_00480 [Bacteroidia bacterium]